MTKIPIVSVLMTAYNRAEYISAAIESVLNSSFSNFELIIVDDCSTDNTLEIARIYELQDARVKVYVNELNLGDYPNRNKAAFYAKGKYIKYLDSDDVMYPYCLQVMLGALEKFPDSGFGLSSIGDRDQPYPCRLSPHDSYIENFYGYGHFERAPGSVIIKREAFEKVKGFSGVRMIGDYELWFKLARYYPMVKFPRDLVWDRIHDGQELSTAYAKKEYAILRRRVMEDALSHVDCPLHSTEIRTILKKEKRNLVKQKIKKWL